MSLLERIAQTLHTHDPLGGGAGAQGGLEARLAALRAKALNASDTNMIFYECIPAIDELTQLGDFSLLPQLLERRDALRWDGPIADGMEHMAYLFEAYHAAVQRMVERAGR